MASSGLRAQAQLVGSIQYIQGATFVQRSSRQAAAANAAATVTMPATAGRTNWLSAYVLWVGSAATAGVVSATISGLPTNLITDDLTFTTTQGDRLIVQLPEPCPASAANVAIVATVPASGVSGPAIGVDLYGFLL